jgi:hypothetical protein
MVVVEVEATIARAAVPSRASVEADAPSLHLPILSKVRTLKKLLEAVARIG